MNLIDQAFQNKSNNLLNVYFTAGFPNLEDTIRIAESLEKSGADMIEIGMPYSDPIADGPTIQGSSSKALENGMTLSILFQQLAELRNKVSIPVILMGYLNPVIQFGIENFCAKCMEVGINGVILPDLPMQEYLKEYKSIFDKFNLYNIFLITPQTGEQRIRMIDENTKGFIYMVSSSSITGAKSSVNEKQKVYFDRIRNMNLKSRLMIGFGISNKETFIMAINHANGAIIGSAFINQLAKDASPAGIKSFIESIIK